MHLAPARVCLTAASLVLTGATVFAQSPEPDPAAMKAFSDMVSAYRTRPALGVKTTVKIEIQQGETKSREQERTAEFVLGKRVSSNRDEANPALPQAVVKVNGFTCNVYGGNIYATHEKNSDSYYEISDEGDAFWALTSIFKDLPFPDLALALGEDNVDDLTMQFHPKAAWDKPTAVRDEAVEGKTIRHIMFSSDFDTMDVAIDPETSLMKSIELRITKGDLVQEGAATVYRHSFEYTTHEQPLPDSEFAFNPGTRQKVDVLSTLLPKPEERGGGESLEGKPAPELVLATLTGKAVNLEDLQGRVVVLDFWATWCGPCRAALPKLHEVAKWADEKQLPVTIITVNTFEVQDREKDGPDARLEQVKKFWEKNRFTLPVAMDYSDEVARAYGVSGIPMSVIIRADGIVHAAHSGAGEGYVDQLKRDINEALEAVEAPK